MNRLQRIGCRVAGHLRTGRRACERTTHREWDSTDGWWAGACSAAGPTLQVPHIGPPLCCWSRLLLCGNTAAAADSGLARVIDQAQTKIVKIYGAGGFRGMEGYQSGFLISAEGHVLTALSYVLDTDRITVTLNDGRRYDAKLLGGDPRLEVAVLKIEAANLPHFDLAKAVPLTGGTRILALSNLFNVAMGDEPASVQSGTVSVLTRLEGRRGVFETPYHGPIYVLDVATNNPGASGGALVTFRGELAGMLGKELRNSLNNTWLSYAVPIDQLRQSIDEIKAGKFISLKELPPEKKPAHPMDPGCWASTSCPTSWSGRPPTLTRFAPARPPPGPASSPTT